jgi:hypothetical protein
MRFVNVHVPPSVARLATGRVLQDSLRLCFSTKAQADEIFPLVQAVCPNAELITGHPGSAYEDNIYGEGIEYQGDDDCRVYHIKGTVEYTLPAKPPAPRLGGGVEVAATEKTSVNVLDTVGEIIARYARRGELQANGPWGDADGEVLGIRIDSNANDGSGGAEILWKKEASVFHL